MLDEKNTESKAPGKKFPESAQSRPESKETKPAALVKEEPVTKKEDKRAFSKLCAEMKLTPARVYVIRHYTGWDDSTPIKPSELESAINKYLKGKES